MDVLKAANIYWKCSLAQDAGKSAHDQLLLLAGKLCGEKPARPVNPGDPTSYLKREDLKDPDEGLLATLWSEVNHQEYKEDFPITRDESKNAARNIVNAGREFYVNLVKLSKPDQLNTLFQRIINEWNAYRQTYLSGDFFNKMTASKSEAQQSGDTAGVTKWEARYYFWQELVNMISESIDKIHKLITDELSGNSKTPLQVQPV